MPHLLAATTTFLAAGALLVPRAPPRMVATRMVATPSPPAASISPPPPPPADVWNDDIKERWSVAYSSLREEGDYEITEVEGTIPASLRGTVYRNGPGNFERSGERFAHILDGDGLVCRFSIDGAAGRAHFRSRYVRTPEFLAEEEADAVLYRNTFGTQPDPWWSNAGNLVLKNVANTNIQAWGGKVLALWEAALPVRIDPNTLDCVGEETFDGALRQGRLTVTTGASWLDELAGAPRARLVALPSAPRAARMMNEAT